MGLVATTLMIRQLEFPFLPKDFIETAEGLIFAVVTYQPQQGKVGCFLRYVKTKQGWRKVKTEEANQLLKESYPQYLFHSPLVDAEYHAVLPSDITLHHKPEQRLQHLKAQRAHDEIEQKCISLLKLFEDYGFDTSLLGLTGSMLIDQQKLGSDIDFAVYGRHVFQALRKVIQQAIQDKRIDELDFSLMQDNFERRDCDLSYAEFAWHEQRKFNKAAIQGTKFDIGMVCLPDELSEDNQVSYEKIGKKQIKASVLNDEYIFDFPAIYKIDHKEISEVYCFTPTYCGQAYKTEKVEVTGVVEKNTETGKLRLIVGSTREARGEYIKVITA